MLTIDIIQFWKKTYLGIFYSVSFIPLILTNGVLAVEGESASNSVSGLMPTFIYNLLLEISNYYNQLSATTVVVIMLSVAGIIFLILLITLYRLYHPYTVKQQPIDQSTTQQLLEQSPVVQAQSLLLEQSTAAQAQPSLTVAIDQLEQPASVSQNAPPSVPIEQSHSDWEIETTKLVAIDQTVVEHIISQRLTRITVAHKLVRNHSLAAMGIGLVPLPLVDLAAITGVQLRMLYLLAQQYQVPFQRHLVKSLVASLLSGAVTSSTTTPFASVLKIVPLLGYVSGAVSVSILGGAATYAVGKVFIQHFEFGGTFLNFEPARMRQYFQDFYTEGQQLAVAQVTEQK